MGTFISTVSILIRECIFVIIEFRFALVGNHANPVILSDMLPVIHIWDLSRYMFQAIGIRLNELLHDSFTDFILSYQIDIIFFNYLSSQMQTEA